MVELRQRARQQEPAWAALKRWARTEREQETAGTPGPALARAPWLVSSQTEPEWMPAGVEWTDEWAPSLAAVPAAERMAPLAQVKSELGEPPELRAS